MDRPRVPIGRAGTFWLLLACALVVKPFASPDRHTVFPKFSAGAVHWWDREPLYADYEGLGSFRYPPTFALVMTPFSWFGDRIGGALWNLAQLAVYLAGLRAFARRILRWPVRERRTELFFLLATIGAIRPLWNSQAHVLVSGALLLGASAGVQGRTWRAATWLTLPVFLKVAPLATLALACVAFSPWFLGPALLALLVGIGLPFLGGSPSYVIDQYSGWFDHLTETATRRWDSFRDARTVWEYLAGPPSLPAYHVLQGIAAILAAVWVAWHRRSAASTRSLWFAALALGAVWQLWFGPAVDYKSYVVLAPLSTYALLTSLHQKRGRPLAAGAWLATTILAAGAIERAVAPITDLVFLALPFGTLLFLLWITSPQGRLAPDGS